MAAALLSTTLPALAGASGTSVTGVTVAVSPATAAATGAQYTVGFDATSGLTVGEAVYLTAPSGTVFSASPTAYALNGSVAGAVYGGGSDAVQIVAPAGLSVARGGTVTAAAYGVTNPAAGSYSLQGSTSADTMPAATPNYTLVAPLTITTSTLPTGTLGQSYGNVQLQATGGVLVAPCDCYQNWQATGLPGGLYLDTGSGILSGTPSQAGTFQVTVSVQDQASPPNTATATLTLTVQSAVTGVTATVSPDAAGATNAQYTVGFDATSGLTVGEAVYLTSPGGTVFSTSPTAYALNGSVAGAVYGGGSDAVQIVAPSGLSVARGGTVTAAVYGVTNPAGGSYSLQVSTSADTAPVASPNYTIVAPLMITTSTLPTGTLGQSYGNVQLQATGGVLVAPCDCYQNWQATGLPGGLYLDTGSGILSGTPSQAGTFQVTVSVQDQASPPNTATATLTLTVQSAVTGVTATVSPDAAGATNAQYTVAFDATSGLTVGEAVYLTAPGGTVFSTSPTAYALNGSVAGAVYGGGSDAVQIVAPSGLTVAPGGTVTAAVYGVTNPAAGSYSLQVSTSADTTPVASPNYTIVAPLTITTSTLPTGTLGQSYGNVQLQATGGVLVAPCDCYQNWQATGLPGGLYLDTGSGILSGTPSQAGTFQVTVSVQDQASPPNTATATLTLTVQSGSQPPVLSAVSPASGPVGTVITLTGSGFGTAPGSVYFYPTAGTTTNPAIATGTSSGWSDTQAEVPVPAGLSSGTVAVSVYNSTDGLYSTSQDFTVTQPSSGGSGSGGPGPVGSGSGGTTTPPSTSGGGSTTPPGQTGLGTPASGTAAPTATGLIDAIASGDGTALIQIQPENGQANLNLSASALAAFTSSQGTLRIQTQNLTVNLPSADLAPAALAANPALSGLNLQNAQVDLGIQVANAPSGVPSPSSGAAGNATAVSQVYSFDLQVTTSTGRSVTLENFLQPIVVTMHYQTGSNTDPELLGAYRLDPNGGAPTYVGGTADPTTDTVSVGLTHFSQYVVLQFQPQFTDISGSWAAHDIAVAAAHFITTGISPTEFAPNMPLTRATFVTMLTRALGLPASTVPTGFADVPSSSWYAGAVGAAVRAGLVTGTSATTFDPNADITREQMAVLLERAAADRGDATTLSSAELMSALNQFRDATALDLWAYTATAYAIHAGLVRGEGQGALVPQGTATRAQAVAILVRFLFGSSGN